MPAGLIFDEGNAFALGRGGDNGLGSAVVPGQGFDGRDDRRGVIAAGVMGRQAEGRHLFIEGL